MAEARALGANEVRFLDGRAVAGEQFRAAVQHADIVVLIIAWVKHAVEDLLRAHAPSGVVVARMRTAGLRAFRESLLVAVAPSGGATRVS